MVQRTHCYADGGKVVKDHTSTPAPKAPPPPKPDPSMVGSGMAAKAGNILKDKRKQQMEELGLKDGGPVSKFDRLKGKLAGEPGVTNPAALAASIGRKKFGAAGMAAKAAAGRRKG